MPPRNGPGHHEGSVPLGTAVFGPRAWPQPWAQVRPPETTSLVPCPRLQKQALQPQQGGLCPPGPRRPGNQRIPRMPEGWLLSQQPGTNNRCGTEGGGEEGQAQPCCTAPHSRRAVKQEVKVGEQRGHPRRPQGKTCCCGGAAAESPCTCRAGPPAPP